MNELLKKFRYVLLKARGAIRIGKIDAEVQVTFTLKNNPK